MQPSHAGLRPLTALLAAFGHFHDRHPPVSSESRCASMAASAPCRQRPSRASIAWICFAVVTNAIGGTSRQLAWLGVLVMVPSTLWLLRSQRRVLVAGVVAECAGFLFIFAALHWFKLQPYTEHTSMFDSPFSAVHILWQLIKAFLDVPFLLLPLVALFIPEIRRARPAVIAALVGAYLLVTFQPHHAQHIFLLEPTSGDWIGPHGVLGVLDLHGARPLFLHTGEQVLLTVVSIGGLVGLIVSLLELRRAAPVRSPSSGLSWKQLGTVLGPLASPTRSFSICSSCGRCAGS